MAASGTHQPRLDLHYVAGAWTLWRPGDDIGGAGEIVVFVVVVVLVFVVVAVVAVVAVVFVLLLQYCYYYYLLFCRWRWGVSGFGVVDEHVIAQPPPHLDTTPPPRHHHHHTLTPLTTHYSRAGDGQSRRRLHVWRRFQC